MPDDITELEATLQGIHDSRAGATIWQKRILKDMGKNPFSIESELKELREYDLP